MLTSNTGAFYMRDAIPERPPLSDEADATSQSGYPAGQKRSRLSHRQAQGKLSLLLDATTEPALVRRLLQHVDGCARCQSDLEQLRQAEMWLLAQPVEVPQMVAAQQATWDAIQARIAAEDAPALLAGKAKSNGRVPAANYHAAAQKAFSAPLSAASADAESGGPDHRYRPLPASAALAPVPVFSRPLSKPIHKALLVALAASFVVGSFAVFFLIRPFSNNESSMLNTSSLISMDVLNPGERTPVFSFDPISRRLLTLTGQRRYSCLPGAHCPYLGPECLHFAMLDVSTGQTLKTVQPSCKDGGNTFDSTTFTDLLEDNVQGKALLVGSDQQVTAVDSQSGAVVRKYPLACCPDGYSQPARTILDQRDQLLLTAGQSSVYGVPDTLVAQDALTGQLKYQKALASATTLRAALVSNVTGWVYLWSQCTRSSRASCVEAYQAANGQKVKNWQASSEQTPLAADPTENVLYVREDQPTGQSATLVIDGRSGATLGKLPSAEAMAINAPLHHAYLLGGDGVMVVDTRTRRKLSTLPVLASDGAWVAPAVDTTTNRVYLPIQRGKLVMAQDNAAGQLRLRSLSLSVVLHAEYAMAANRARSEMSLYSWELPIGPGAFPVYHPLMRKTSSSCQVGWVAARSTAVIDGQENGQYQVHISLAWDDQFAQALSSPPTLQPSYSHEHIWRYAVTTSGAAWFSGEQGETFSSCQAAGG